ncbi:MAG: hypothetical protein V2I67_19350 [Thermoanaerobaculales bacterium]|jgi:lipoate-protein ligase A|nr:hypothetical protein [Thermoanaerobaculales bacterium]
MTGGLEVFSSSGPASHDLAFEAEMLERAVGGRCSLLTASWEGPVVVLGYAQPPADVDLKWCRSQGIPVLRRLSGGTGVIHRRDLSISLALPREHPWAASIVGLYGRFLDVVQPALAAAGGRVERVAEPAHATRVRSPICFEDQLADTLVVDGRKAVGCSQARRKDAVLIHAAVLVGLDAALYARVFDVEADRVAAGLAPAVPGADPAEVAAVVERGFAGGLDLGIRRSSRPRPSAGALEPYGLERWAPVRDGGIQ